MKHLLFICILALSLSNCSSQKVYLQGDLTGPPTYSKKQHFYLYGIGQEFEVNATSICKKEKKKLSRVQTRQTIGDSLATIFTLGLYAPKTLEISCL